MSPEVRRLLGALLTAKSVALGRFATASFSFSLCQFHMAVPQYVCVVCVPQAATTSGGPGSDTSSVPHCVGEPPLNEMCN